jgi:hypothetical protein
MIEIEKGIKIKKDKKIYFLKSIVEMVAVENKLKPKKLLDEATYPTDMLNFIEHDGNDRFSVDLFKFNSLVRKKKIEII